MNYRAGGDLLFFMLQVVQSRAGGTSALWGLSVFPVGKVASRGVPWVHVQLMFLAQYPRGVPDRQPGGVFHLEERLQ